VPTVETYLATKELVLEYPFLRSPQVMHLVVALGECHKSALALVLYSGWQYI